MSEVTFSPYDMVHIVRSMKPFEELMIQRLYVNPKLIALVLDECSFCRRFYLYEKGIGYELECFLNTLLEKRDQKFIGGQVELLQRKIESLQFIKMMLEVYFIPNSRRFHLTIIPIRELIKLH